MYLLRYSKTDRFIIKRGEEASLSLLLGLQVLEEIAILQRLHHENLVSYLLVADQGSKISIMMNWAGQSLRDFAAADQQQHFAESLAQHITCQLTRTLVYLHGKVCCTSRSSIHSGYRPAGYAQGQRQATSVAANILMPLSHLLEA